MRQGVCRGMKSHHLRMLGVVVAGLIALLAVSGAVGASGTLNPTISLELSTTRATSHPDARITIDNSASSENIKSISMQLPSGFWGSLAAATKCDYADAQDGDCGSSSQIGTVDTTAKIDDSDARLRGKVYLTEPAPANAADDPAGISVVVPARAGSVDLGNVVVNARVAVRNAALAGNPTDAVGAIEGVNTIVEDVPEEITDTHNRKVSFRLQRMTIDLRSKLGGPKPPLLTNPSSCATPLTLSASFTGRLGGSATATDPNPIQVTGCPGATGPTSVTSIAPTVTTSLSNPTAGGLSAMTTEMTFPTDSPSVKVVDAKLPPLVGLNFPAMGSAADQCSASAAPLASSPFRPQYCPAQARVGSVTIETPLIDGPVVGNVYVINKSPLPWLGIDVNPSVSPSNPKGVFIRIVGVSFTPAFNSLACDEDPDQCGTQIRVLFNNLPDAPLSKITLNIDGPDRTGIGDVVLSGKILTVASPSDPVCQATDDYTFAITSNTGVGSNAVKTDRVVPQNISGCNSGLHNSQIPTQTGSDAGKIVPKSTAPKFSFSADGGYVGDFECALDNSLEGETCESPFTGPTSLSVGLHRFFVKASGDLVWRAFAVSQQPSPVDTTAPTATLGSHPSSVESASPMLSFGSDDSSAKLQCAINPGESVSTAFLPCGNGTSGSADLGMLNLAPLVAGQTYTFAVRAEDGAGNVGAADQTTFTVDVPFDPSFEADVSTSAARAHPDLDVTIENPSHEDLKDLEFQMPDGFFGGLTGVASICSLTDADSGNCSTSSKVGTVDAEAAVDESTVRVSGDVFLTEPRNPLVEPASLSIKIRPAIQDVVFDDVIVTANLKVRGEAEGIDTFALDLPTSATNAIDGPTEFDMRKMVLKLRTGVGAAHPLLTNPSSCAASEFKAEFSGTDNSVKSASQAFAVTGCTSLPFDTNLTIAQSDSDTGGVPAASSDAKRVNVNFSASLVANADGSAIKSVSLTLPEPLTIDVGHLPPVCQIAEAALKACPSTSAVGSVVANTPLLPEPLNGTVYVLKSETSLPRLLIALRGRINTDIIAVNRFTGPNFNIIQTTIENIPDAPISSFSMTVNRFLMTRDTACDVPSSAWNITGGLTAQSGAVNAVNIPLQFDCAPTGPEAQRPTFTKPKISGTKKRFTLKTAVRTQDGKKIKKLTIKLPSGLKFDSKKTASKKIAKYVSVKADGKALKAKCFRRRSANTLEVNFCKKQVSRIDVYLKRGSVNARKKFSNKKPPKISVKVVDSDGKTKTAGQR